MRDKSPSLTQTNVPSVEGLLLIKKFKVAKTKSALASVTLAVILLGIFIVTSTNHMNGRVFVLSSLIISMASSLITYPFILYFGFGRRIIGKLKKLKIVPEQEFFSPPKENLITDMINAEHGYGPASIGFITNKSIHIK